jgi:putative DNA primase/helicase
MSASHVLKRIDFPPEPTDASRPSVAWIFIGVPEDHPPGAKAEAITKAGLAELKRVEAIIRSSRDDDREPTVGRASEYIHQLQAADVIHGDWAKVSLFRAASECGLVRDTSAKAVEAVIAAGIKLAKKHPRNLIEITEVRGAARARHQASRPREAADHVPSSPPAADDAGASASSFAAVSPAPPDDGGKSTQSTRTGGFRPKASAGGQGDGRKPPRASETDEHRNMRLAFFPLTDLGNAERFRERFCDRLRWYPPKETWLAWDGKRWSAERASEVVKRAEHVTVRAIQDEAEAVRQSGRRDIPDALPGALDYLLETKRDGTEILYSDKISRWGRSSEAFNKVSALSKLGGAYLAVSTGELDADKMKINVNNGTLVVSRRSEGDYINFRPHDPADLITKISPVDFDPAAECPEYDKFLARVHPSEPMRLFLHQWLGLSLTGDVSEQKLVYLYGTGANGKSVLMDTASYIAGDYGETVPIETFLDSGRARSAGQASPDLAILPAIRMLRTSEPETNSKLAEAMIKLTTGGEPILARHLNKGFFKFYPQFKLTISGNHKPKIFGADDGIWRRFQLVPFNIQIPKEERDRKLSEKLITEAAGILNRLLDGLRLWCDRGLIEPDEVTAATAEYRSLSDPLSRFLADCVEASPGDRIQSSALYAVFEAWCKSAGESLWKQKGFSLAMDERGFKRKHSNGSWFLDMKLIRTVVDFVGVGEPHGEEADARDAEF